MPGAQPAPDPPSAAAEADPRLSGRAIKRIAFDEAAIAKRVTELGKEITAAYPGGDLLVLFHFYGKAVIRPLAKEKHPPQSKSDALDRRAFQSEAELLVVCGFI